MKKGSKVILLFIVVNFYTFSGFSQGMWLKAIRSFNDLSETVVTVFFSWKGIDSSINKEKARTMASELIVDVEGLIYAKELIVYRLKNTTNINPNLRIYIDTLKKKLENIDNTLYKYDALITKAGVNAQNLRFSLNLDFLHKAQTLESAQGTFDKQLPTAEIREYLIIYFSSCINILKNTRNSLVNFKP